MKQKILEALKTKFPGSNAKVLDRIAEALAKTVSTEEQVATAVAGVTQELIAGMEAYGDARATEAQQTAVQNYETKHGLKDGKPNQQAQKPTAGQGDGDGDDTPAWAKALIDSNKSLSDRLAKMEGARTADTRKQQLAAIIGKLPEPLRKPYERLDFEGKSDEDFAASLTEITAEVDGIVADVKAKGAVFGRPTAQHGGNGGDGQLSEEQLKAITAKPTAGADGQPF